MHRAGLLSLLFSLAAVLLRTKRVPASALLTRFCGQTTGLVRRKRCSRTRHDFSDTFTAQGMGRSFVCPVLLGRRTALLVCIKGARRTFTVGGGILPCLPRVSSLRGRVDMCGSLNLLCHRRRVGSSALCCCGGTLSDTLRCKSRD